MKRKFFSLMVAACAAVFSVSGLTCCGGGGGDGSGESHYGYLTVNDFQTCKKGIRLMGAAWMDILPESVDSKTENAVMMDVILTGGSNLPPLEAKASYAVTSYQLADDGSMTTIPQNAVMQISLDDPNDTDDQMLLAALCMNRAETDTTVFASGLVLNMTFSANGNLLTYSVSNGSIDATTGAVNVTPQWTTFYVVKVN